MPGKDVRRDINKFGAWMFSVGALAGFVFGYIVAVLVG